MNPLVNQDPAIIDREWMTLSFPNPRFISGIRSFLKFAREHLPGRETIVCPCATCRCLRLPVCYDDLEIHLMKNGFDPSYRVWDMHGEHVSPKCTEYASSSQQYHNVLNLNEVHNAIVQELGGNNLDDNRGRMRGLGCSITKTGLKMSDPARSKVENLIKGRESLVQEISDIKKTLAKMEAWMEMQQHAQSTQNLSSPTLARSAQSSSPDIIYIGQRCDLLGWGNRDVVARGQVHAVNPNAVVHCEPLEEGAFVIILTEIIHPDTRLWKEDEFASTLGEAGPGSFVQWGKESLRFR